MKLRKENQQRDSHILNSVLLFAITLPLFFNTNASVLASLIHVAGLCATVILCIGSFALFSPATREAVAKRLVKQYHDDGMQSDYGNFKMAGRVYDVLFLCAFIALYPSGFAVFYFIHIMATECAYHYIPIRIEELSNNPSE